MYNGYSGHFPAGVITIAVINFISFCLRAGKLPDVCGQEHDQHIKSGPKYYKWTRGRPVRGYRQCVHLPPDGHVQAKVLLD